VVLNVEKLVFRPARRLVIVLVVGQCREGGVPAAVSGFRARRT